VSCLLNSSDSEDSETSYVPECRGEGGVGLCHHRRKFAHGFAFVAAAVLLVTGTVVRTSKGDSFEISGIGSLFQYVDGVQIREYRTALPVSVDEYHVGLLYTHAAVSKAETGGGEGVEVVTNHPFEGRVPGESSGKVFQGQYSHKILHLKSKVPRFMQLLAPTGSLEVDVKTHDLYPYVRTEVTNNYMKDKFVLTFETRYVEGDCFTDNVHHLPVEVKAKRTIEKIDFVTDQVDTRDYTDIADPAKFVSAKTGRGPLSAGWDKHQQHLLCENTLVSLKFKWFGLQTKVEKIILSSLRRFFLRFDREAWSSIDEWYGLSLGDIRALEEETKHTLDQLRKTGKARGMFVA